MSECQYDEHERGRCEPYLIGAEEGAAAASDTLRYRPMISSRLNLVRLRALGIDEGISWTLRCFSLLLTWLFGKGSWGTCFQGDLRNPRHVVCAGDFSIRKIWQHLPCVVGVEIESTTA